MFNFIKYTNVWLGIAGVAMAISLVLFVVTGLKPGIDFTGGSSVTIKFENGSVPNTNAIRTSIPDSFGPATLQTSGTDSYIVRLRHISDTEHAELLTELKTKLEKDGLKISESSFETVGPSIGMELRSKAWKAILATILAIVLFIAWAFRKVSYPVESWKYGVIAIIALVHDILLPIGVFVLLGKYASVEVDILFITALLAILGYSINDTIIIFDRVRENIVRYRGKSFEEIVNSSLNETIVRSFNTSFTVVLVLLAILVWSEGSIKYFILTLLIGIISGTYSSIFIASPLLVLWHKIGLKKAS